MLEGVSSPLRWSPSAVDSQKVTSAGPALLLSLLMQSVWLTGMKERNCWNTFDMALDRQTDLQTQSTGETESDCNGLQISLETQTRGLREERGCS